jgi:hypothetical protein
LVLTHASILLAGQLCLGNYVVTHAHNITGESEVFTSCERCTHITSTRDVVSLNKCAHGLLLQLLIPVLKGQFVKETQSNIFSDQFMCWALSQSQNHESIVKLRTRGGVHTFFIIGDPNLCLRQGSTPHSLCAVLISQQGIRLECRSTNCKTKNRSKSKKRPRGTQHDELDTACPHLQQLISSELYQGLIDSQNPDIRESLQSYL